VLGLVPLGGGAAGHVIHNRNGRIGGANSYGRDPHPPRG